MSSHVRRPRDGQTLGGAGGKRPSGGAWGPASSRQSQQPGSPPLALPASQDPHTLARVNLHLLLGSASQPLLSTPTPTPRLYGSAVALLTTYLTSLGCSELWLFPTQREGDQMAGGT